LHPNPVKHDDLSLAFDFVSYAVPTEHDAYVSLDTGKIYWTFDSSDALDEIPDDLETSDRYLAIPHRNELDLGDVSPCALSHRSCLHVSTRSKDYSGGKELMSVLRICWSVRAFSIAGIRLKPMLSKAR
jgi:hypothetical protein